MIAPLIWASAFIFICLVLGGSAALCVRMIEHGKTTRVQEHEKTVRQGMDNAWQLEQSKLTALPASTNGKPHTLTEVAFRLDERAPWT